MCPSVRRNSWSLARLRTSTPSAARRAAAGEAVPDESVVVLTFDGKGVVLHPARGDAQGGRQAPAATRAALRVQPPAAGREEAATVAAVYAVAPLVRSPEDFLQSLMPRQPAAKAGRIGPRPRRCPRPVAKRSGRGGRGKPSATTRSASSAECSSTQRIVEAGAAAYGVDVSGDPRRVEYVWKAAHVFHREGSPDAAHWAWTRVQSILEGKSSKVAAAMRRCGGLVERLVSPPTWGSTRRICTTTARRWSPGVLTVPVRDRGPLRRRRSTDFRAPSGGPGAPPVSGRPHRPPHLQRGSSALAMPLAAPPGPLWTAAEPHPSPGGPIVRTVHTPTTILFEVPNRAARGWTSVRRTRSVVHPAAAMIVPASNVGDVSPLIATAMSVIKQTRGPQDVG